MSILFSLAFLTCIIVFLQFRIWKLERNIAFPIFTGIFYFWSLAGAWLFCLDNLTHIGKNIGFQYYYLLEKMFPVAYDGVYHQTLWMYASFIICFQLFTWIGLKWIKKLPVKEHLDKVITLKSTSFVLIAMACLALSFWIVKDVIFYSFLLNESVYINIRTAPIPGYTLHQYACWAMVVSLFLYLGLFLREKQTFVVVQKPKFIFWIVFAVCNVYLIMIGSRHETFFGGVVVFILMSYPFRSIRKYKALYAVVVSVWLLILMLNDPIRSLMPVIASKTGLTNALNTAERTRDASLFQSDRTFIAHKSPKKSAEISKINALRDTVLYLGKDSIRLNKIDFLDQQKLHPSYLILGNRKIKFNQGFTSLRYQNNSLATKIALSISNLVFSNELFAGHFSMYGVVNKHVPVKVGLSFKNLVYSFIPSTIVKERPLDSYTYYAQKMNFTGKQGFTINHITSWYLNASYFGFIFGSFLLSLFLLLPFYLSLRLTNALHKMYAIIALCGMTGFGAMLIRSGPEAYKAMLYESVLIPIFIVLSAVILRKISLILKSKYGK